MLGEHVTEVCVHCVTEDDGVGDLHHRGLEVNREQNVLCFGIGNLRSKECVECLGAHECCVNDLARKNWKLFFQHGGGAVVAHEFDLERVGLFERDRLFV
ncbi:unannotated protein [freshwater metagenome]|uniref:Unannotated protein n=1 Tax=freshwater metagenome TaxID=449393 RepID=A0A6J6EUX5_9ZZZZ